MHVGGEPPHGNHGSGEIKIINAIIVTIDNLRYCRTWGQTYESVWDRILDALALDIRAHRGRGPGVIREVDFMYRGLSHSSGPALHWQEEGRRESQHKIFQR